MDTKHCFKNNSFIFPARYLADQELETKHQLASIPDGIRRAFPCRHQSVLVIGATRQTTHNMVHDSTPKCCLHGLDHLKNANVRG